jgi:hypothetical protein
MSKEQFFDLQEEEMQQEPRGEALRREWEQCPQTYVDYVNSLSDDEVAALFDNMKQWPFWTTSEGKEMALAMPIESKADWYRGYVSGGRIGPDGWENGIILH